MDNVTYQSEALKTLSDAPTYHHFVSQQALKWILSDSAEVSHQAELMKKQLFYGKDIGETPVDDPVTVRDMDILHAQLGIIGEAGEVVQAKTEDEVKKEVGDLLWFVALLLDKHGLTFSEVMQGNIDKLRARYASGGFTREEALNRADMVQIS